MFIGTPCSTCHSNNGGSLKIPCTVLLTLNISGGGMEITLDVEKMSQLVNLDAFLVLNDCVKVSLDREELDLWVVCLTQKMRHNLDSVIVSFPWRRLDLKYSASQKKSEICVVFFKVTYFSWIYYANGNFAVFWNIVLIFWKLTWYHNQSSKLFSFQTWKCRKEKKCYWQIFILF